MLKLIGELVVGALAVYAVRKPLVANARGAADAACEGGLLEAASTGFVSGVQSGCIALGSVVAFPITAPLGAVMLVKDCYTNREVITQSASDAYDTVAGWFVKAHVATAQLACEASLV